MLNNAESLSRSERACDARTDRCCMPPGMGPMVEQMEIGLRYDTKEASEFPSGTFDARRAAANRQRLIEHAVLVTACILSILTIALSIKVFQMNGDMRELRAEMVVVPEPRPDYYGTADLFVGGYTRHGHTLDANGPLHVHDFPHSCVLLLAPRMRRETPPPTPMY